MSLLNERRIEAAFREALSAIPAPRPIRSAAPVGHGVWRRVAVAATLAGVATAALAFSDIETAAAAGGLSCADLGTKVRIWVASLVPNTEGRQIDEVGGVPVVVRWSAERSALRVEAPTEYLLQAGCGNPNHPSTSPSRRSP